MKPLTLRSAALWLALAGMLYRSLVPAGFMPAAGEAVRAGMWLTLCPHGQLHDSRAAPAAPHQPAGDHGIQLCPFGTAAATALPGAVADFPVELAAALLADEITARHACLTFTVLPPARASPYFS